MHQALLMLKEEGLENRIRRCAGLGEACRTAAKAIGLGLLAEKGFESNTVTAIRYPEGIDDGKFRGTLWKKHRVLVAGGQSVVKGKIFRIGHMGICSYNDMLATWGAVEATFKELGYKFDVGAAVAAVEDFIE
jgi:aspartate aminotransferase-like enzyme